MSEPALQSRIKVQQRERQYRIRWDKAPPLALPDTLRSCAKRQTILATNAVARALVLAGKPPSREPWRSSTTRTDTGDHSSEVVYACALTRIGRRKVLSSTEASGLTATGCRSGRHARRHQRTISTGSLARCTTW